MVPSLMYWGLATLYTRSIWRGCNTWISLHLLALLCVRSWYHRGVTKAAKNPSYPIKILVSFEDEQMSGGRENVKGPPSFPGNMTTGSLTRETSQMEEGDRSEASKGWPRVLQLFGYNLRQAMPSHSDRLSFTPSGRKCTQQSSLKLQ